MDRLVNGVWLALRVIKLCVPTSKLIDWFTSPLNRDQSYFRTFSLHPSLVKLWVMWMGKLVGDGKSSKAAGPLAGRSHVERFVRWTWDSRTLQTVNFFERFVLEEYLFNIPLWFDIFYLRYLLRVLLSALSRLDPQYYLQSDLDRTASSYLHII